MEKVYAVFQRGYQDESMLIGVFSTKKKARKCVAVLARGHAFFNEENWRIQKFKVDKWKSNNQS